MSEKRSLLNHFVGEYLVECTKISDHTYEKAQHEQEIKACLLDVLLEEEFPYLEFNINVHNYVLRADFSIIDEIFQDQDHRLPYSFYYKEEGYEIVTHDTSVEIIFRKQDDLFAFVNKYNIKINTKEIEKELQERQAKYEELKELLEGLIQQPKQNPKAEK